MTQTTRIWWVRHGPTHINGFVGWTDAPADLSDEGLISRLAAHLPTEAVVISSDLQRAAKTADAIAGGRQRLPHDPDLREMNFGAWEMKSFKEVSALDPEGATTFWTNPGDSAPKDGESWNQTCARTNRAVDRLISAHEGQDIIAVAHIGVILAQLQQATQMPPSVAMSFAIDNLSVTRLDFLGQGWRVDRVNHLV